MDPVPVQSAVLPPPVAATTPGLLRPLVPQLIWEAVLLVGVIVVLAGVTVAHSGALTKGGNFAGLVAILGFMAAAFALSVRTATPNLAVATIGGLCGYLFAKLVSGGTATVLAGLLAVLAAIGFGLVMALIAGLTALPAWAVTLAVGFVLQGVLFSGNLESIPLGRGLTSASTYWMWVAVFAIVSIVGAVAFAIPAVRAALTRNRPEPGDVPGRFTPGKLLGATVGLVGSSALAGFAGILSTERQGAAFPTDGSALLVYALAAVLIAGVSPLGGRGGILGVVLAVLFVEGLVTWLNLAGAKSGTMFLAVGVIAVVGLLVNWLLELIGRLTAPKVVT
jgi:ribose/xylose/arabinose/galactoside ABC-type transport system permease subunit